MSEDEGEKGENGTHAAVLLRFGVLVVVGLENPLLELLLLLLVLAGLDSFELAVEGGEGRYLTPVVEDGVDDIISFPCLVLKGDGDDDDIIVEPEADNGRGLFMLPFFLLFSFRDQFSYRTLSYNWERSERKTYVFARPMVHSFSFFAFFFYSWTLLRKLRAPFDFRLSRSQDFLSEGAKFVSSACQNIRFISFNTSCRCQRWN